MSYTKRQYIDAAFVEIGLGSSGYDIQPDQYESAMRRMDSMISSWPISVGYPLPSSPEDSDLDSETNVPDMAHDAIILGLAVRLAPSYGKQVSPDTRKAAKESYNSLLSKRVKPIQMQMPGDMPSGAGNKSSSCRRYLNEPVDRLSVGEDVLDL